MTSGTGTVAQTLDYYPYGAERISTGDDATDRHYIGERFDDETELNYLNARYYHGSRAQFLSQDPVFLAVGNANRIEQLTEVEQNQLLQDPQALHSYSYARANPIRFSDPEGLWYKEFITGQQSWSSFHGELGEAAYRLGESSPTWNYAFENPVRAGGAVGIGSGLAALAAAGGIVIGAGFNATNAIVGGLNAYGWSQATQSYLQYQATASQAPRNEVIFAGIVQGASLLGTSQQGAALNILSAALTALSIELQSISKGQSSDGSNQEKNQ